MSYIYQKQNNHYLRKQNYNQNRSHSYYNYNSNKTYYTNHNVNTSNNIDTTRPYQSRYKHGMSNSGNSYIDANSGTNENGLATLYMGDLDTSWDESVISNLWKSIGVSNINLKMMWQPNTNNRLNQGYCFIEFPTNKEASYVLLNYNGTPIPNIPDKFFKLNWSNNFSNNANSHKNNEITSVFVGDLAPTVTETQLFELFNSRYKSTVSAKIIMDLSTGLSKGYGFVKFSDPLDQQNALVEMQGVYLSGRAIKLDQGNNNNNNMTVSASKNNNSKSYVSTSSQQLPRSQFVVPNQHAPQINHFTDPNNTTVFIGGLSSSVTEDELKSIFEPFGPMVYINIPKGKGCGFIQFVDKQSGEAAISNMQGFPIGNSRIRLSWGRSFKHYNNNFNNHSSSNSTNNKKNLYLKQPSIPNPIYTTHFAHLRMGDNTTTTANTNTNNSNKNDILEYLPGFQNNYFINENVLTNNIINSNNNISSMHSFDRLENRSNRYL